MADVKISGLPASTTPLAGTEVLPIVQSGVTKQVANNDLRPKQIQSNATSGVLQIAGPASATTRIMTTPDANFTAARIDAAQSFTGDQTLSTGNLVIGTSGKGIDFSATPGTGTSELLADYEEGTWTPVDDSGAGLTFSSVSGKYIKIGNQVTVSLYLFYPTTANANNAAIAGLPYTSGPQAINMFLPSTASVGTCAQISGGQTKMVIANIIGVTAVTNSTLSSKLVYGAITYFTV